jgi:NAD(P)-dependent dehydrogenase (short-subunit alcohol dehydrogenase family)
VTATPDPDVMTDATRLDGKVAVVTGGTAGIGAGIAAELGRAGATVIVASRRPEATTATAEALRTAGVTAVGVPTDVTSEASVAALTEEAVRLCGGVDVLVNNAGGSYGDRFQRGPLLELSGDDLLEAYRLNAVSAFLCSRAAVPLMQSRGAGVIVNVASVAGHHAERGMGAYGASKAAMAQLTKSMALEWAPEIRVNAVAPGHIDTPRVSARRTPERVQRLLSEIVLGRMGTVADVARSVRYLASPASAWMTGAIITLDGGQRLG